LQDKNEYQVYLQNLFSICPEQLLASDAFRPLGLFTGLFRGTATQVSLIKWKSEKLFVTIVKLPRTAEAGLQTLKLLPGITSTMAAFDFELKAH